MLTWIKRIVVVVAVLAVLSGAGAWYFGDNKAAAVQFRTSPVTRGDVVSAIGATGTLEPETVVDVGSQVTGQILKFGSDAQGKQFDYSSNVKAGDLLALIDDTTYAASVLEAKAQLAQAQAGLQRANADKLTASAKLTQATNDWQRAEKIGPSDALAATAYDTFKSTYDQAQAAVGVADAAIVSAKATIDQTDSAVKRAQRNLDYCTIKCPVDGMIIDRRVNIGQTVVSSLNVSSLFLIAKDLHQMQVWVAVNEADIGNIHIGQVVTFTCDAFGERVFKGKVGKIRMNAQMTQNVVIYTIEVDTDNPDLKLLPYLTANVQFEVARKNDVLTVPNGALRWTPTAEQVAPDARAEFASDNAGGGGGHKWGGGGMGGGGGGGMGGGGGGRGGDGGPGGGKPGGGTGTGSAAVQHDRPGTLWVKDGEFVRPLKITAGVTDGAVTEVRGDKLDEKTEVVTGVTVPGTDAAAAGSTNPFIPQFKRR